MLSPRERDTHSERTGRSRMRQERLSQVIRSYRQSLQDTRGNPQPPRGVAAGEITSARLACACYAIRWRAVSMCPCRPALPPGSL
jgi:hypothetical protein